MPECEKPHVQRGDGFFFIWKGIEMNKKQNEEVIFVDTETLSEEEMLQGDSYEREDDSDDEEEL